MAITGYNSGYNRGYEKNIKKKQYNKAITEGHSGSWCYSSVGSIEPWAWALYILIIGDFFIFVVGILFLNCDSCG